MDNTEDDTFSFKKSFTNFVISMCKNAVQHNQSLKLEATIVITIDGKSVEIIQLNEMFYSNEYIPEQIPIERMDHQRQFMPRMRGAVVTPRAKRMQPMMKRTPRSMPAKIVHTRNTNFGPPVGATNRRLHFRQPTNQIRPLMRNPPRMPGQMHAQIKYETPEVQTPNRQSQATYFEPEDVEPQINNSSVICLGSDDENGSSFPVTDSEMAFSPQDSKLDMKAIILKTEMNTDMHGCAYCALEFSNMRLLRTHMRLSHADISTANSSTVQNTSYGDGCHFIE